MGIDLKILMNVNSGRREIFHKNIKDIGFYTATQINFDRDFRLFVEIKKLNNKECDFDVELYEGNKINSDLYGELLRYTLAKEFKKIEIKEEYSLWNRTLIKFLSEIEEDVIIVLYWC